ncbi:hypothetical protein ONZ45_g7340 [Pleurotus djamor]|nr:hypothetical protein ONZ45_g7340 [Pleurotus djamor]
MEDDAQDVTRQDRECLDPGQGHDSSRPATLCEACWQGSPMSNSHKDPFWFTTALSSNLPERTSWGQQGLNLHKDHASERCCSSFNYDISSLRETASSGCEWCQLMMRFYERFSDRRYFHLATRLQLKLVFLKVRNQESYLPTHDGPRLDTMQSTLPLPHGLEEGELMEITTWIEGDGITSKREQFHLLFPYTDYDDPLSNLIRARSPMLDVQSEHAHKLALRCIEECNNNHSDFGCGARTVPKPLPTRVIDCSDPEHPRLLSTNGSNGTYVTLSYVWGGDQPHKTTKNNISSYYTGIQATHLPQTIKDAIITTQSLGLIYLWVDSLCIIQDSTEDKTRELGQMARIYANAYLTIIAADASSVSQGFLQRRPAQPMARFHVRCPNDQLGNMYLWWDSSNTNAVPDPIDTRAWCYQEWILSPRALVFSSKAMEYYCNNGTVRTGNAIVPERKERLPGTILPSVTPEPQLLTPKIEFAFRDTWFRVVAEYTRRQMTEPSDRLVALAGVAEMFGLIFATDYLAGLWRKTLLEDLSWEVPVAHSTPQRRPSVNRKPSWSWVAVDGEVELQRLGSATPIAKVLRCDVTLKAQEHAYGAVTDGTLVLQAPLLKARPRGSSSPDKVELEILDSCNGRTDTQGLHPTDTNYGVVCKNTLFNSDSEHPQRSSLSIVQWLKDNTGVRSRLKPSSESTSRLGSPGFRKVLGTFDTMDHTATSHQSGSSVNVYLALLHSDKYSVYGLILSSAGREGQAQGTSYRRVGVFNGLIDDGFIESLDSEELVVI